MEKIQPPAKELYSLLISIKPALQVLQTMLRVVGLKLGEFKAGEMIGWIEEIENFDKTKQTVKPTDKS